MDDIDGEIGHTLGLSIEFHENGQYEEAISYGTVCLQMAIENCNEDAEMNACLVIGQSELALRDYDNAIFHCMTSLDIAKKKLDQVVEMKSCLALGDAQCVLENYDEALMYSWRSLDLAKEIDVHYEAKACLVLAETYSALGKYDKVISFGRRAHSISQMTSSGKERHVEMRSCLVVASAFRTSGNYNEAIEYAWRCIDIAKYKYADKYVEMKACLFLTQSYEDLGESDKTLLCAQMLQVLAKEIDDKENQKIACVFIMETYRSLKQYKEAVHYAKMHIKLVKETGDKQAEMETDFFIADTQFHARNYTEAVKYALMCIDVAKEIGDMCSEIYACVLIGMASRPLKSYLDIIEYAKQCIEHENDDHGNKKIGFVLLGFVDDNLKKYHNAVSNFRKAIDHAKEEGDENGEMLIRFILGEAYIIFNKLDDAISCFKSSSETAKKIGSKEIEMKSYLRLSDCYAMLNRSDEVEVNATNALGIAKELDDIEGQKKANIFLGNVYRKSNRESEAAASLKECVEMSKESGDALTELCASMMVPVSSFSDAKKRMEKGQEIINRFTVRQPTNCYETIHSFICSIYDALISLMKVDPSLQFAGEGINCILMQRLEIQKRFQCSVQPVIHSMEELINAQPFNAEEEAAMRKLLQTLPGLEQSQKEIQSFEEYLVHLTKFFDTLLSVFEDLSSIASYLPAIFHSCNGVAYYLLGDSPNAKASCEKAIRCFESLFDHLHDVDKSKISIVDKYVDTYKLLSKILIGEDNTKEALLVAERCRAKALKDVLVLEHGLNKGVMQEVNELNGIWPVLKTLKFSILFYTVSFIEIHKFAMEDRLHFSVHLLPFRDWMLKKLIKEMYEELNLTSAFRCQSSPWVCSQAQQMAKSGESKEMWEKMLRQFSSLGMMPGISDWSDMNEDVKEEIWNEVERFFEDPGNTKAKKTSLTSVPETKLSAQMILEAFAGVPPRSSRSAMEALSEMLLGNVPLEKDEVVIIPDDLLSIVPFAALTNPATGRYLSEDKKIRFAPSLTTLKVLSESREDFHTLKGAILIGDPDVGNVLYNDVEITVSRLEAALHEANIIADKFRVSPLTGAHATKRTVLEKLHEGASVVHIAAHGSLDKATIYLAPDPEVRAVRIPNEEDYMLTMAEVQQAQVRAQLVVLSCCYSGRGQIRAEGVVGMCRAFLASGARAVVASLWAIDDQATLDFMLEFYERLQDGESASTSLQTAMEEMRHTYKEPKYWAPFFLMGDDVKITF